MQRVFAKMNAHYKLIDHTPVPIIKIPILPKLLFFHKCQELLVPFCTILKFYGTSFIVYHLGSPRSPGNTRKSSWSCKAKVLTFLCSLKVVWQTFSLEGHGDKSTT